MFCAIGNGCTASSGFLVTLISEINLDISCNFPFKRRERAEISQWFVTTKVKKNYDLKKLGEALEI